MKILSALLYALVLPGVAVAQEVVLWDDIPVILDAYGHKISPDGSFSTGEAVSSQSAWGRDNLTGKIYYYDGASCGDGNNISKDHIVVGTDKVFMKAALLLPEEDVEPYLIPSLSKYGESYLHGINWDGTRIVGFLSNPDTSISDEYDPEKQRMSYLPFYCDVDPDSGTVSDPIFLPTPKYDFFGLVPQYCTAFWISDDGSTILGQVIDNSGNFIYPIIYKQDAEENWTYMLPSEKLSIPDGVEIPVYPKPEMSQPLPQNYIENPEFKTLYLELWEQFLKGETEVNPDEMLNPETAGEAALMTKEEWDSYNKDLTEYNNYIIFIYDNELNEYYEKYSKFISQSTNFLQSSMAMNRAGTLFSQTKMVTRFSGNNPIKYHRPIVFNLEDGSYQEYGDDLSELEVNQILPDGTLIASTLKPGPTSPDLTPQHSYACAPGSSSFATIENYIKNSNPSYYQWYQDYLYHEVPIGYDEIGNIVYIDLTVSGLVAVSDDFSTLSGGVDAWSWNLENGEYYTYIFKDIIAPDAGVNFIPNEVNDTIRIYNLQGSKILETTNRNVLKSLEKGIYIINGKKVFIK